MHFLFALLLAFFVVACGDDESSFAPRDEESSSSVTPTSSSWSSEGTIGSSSSVKSSSSKKETSSSSSKEQGDGGSSAAMTSSSAKSSSSKKETSSSSRHSGLDPESSSTKGDGGSEAAMTSSSAKSSSSVSSSSEYVPFDHSQTLAGAWRIGEDRYKTFTDPRNGRSYYYITITGTDTVRKVASVTVMAENLNIGVDVPGDQDQNDDTKIERYCYNNDTTKCDEFGGLYQWAEMMQLPSECNTKSCADQIKPNHQGICPDGWRVFNFNDYVIIINAEGNDDGVKGMRSTYGFSGTNYSGFSLTGAGKRTKKGGFDSLKEKAYWYLPEEFEGMEATHAHFGVVSALTESAPNRDRRDVKLYGLSVRCVMVENQAE